MKKQIKTHSLEMEKSLLSCMTKNKDIIIEIITKVNAEDFYAKDNSLLFKAFEKIATDNLSLNLGVLHELSNVSEEYIDSIFEVRIDKSYDFYIDAVKKYSKTRQILTLANKTIDSMHQGGEADDILVSLGEQVNAIYNNSSNNDEIISLKDGMQKYIKFLDDPGESKLLSTGYADLDKSLGGGIDECELVVICGRPGSLKTTCSVNILENVAIYQKKRVVMFSLEMSATQLIRRIVASVCNIDRSRAKLGTLEAEEFQSLAMKMPIISNAEFYICDKTGLSTANIRSMLKKIELQKGPVDLVCIDHLALVRGSKGLKEYESFTEITKEILNITKDLKTRTILLSQLNRECEKRENKRPIMSDLRGSGSIEQDAHIIWGIYRDEKYNPETKDKGIAEIICMKNRESEPMDSKLKFIGQHSKFVNYAWGY